MDGQERATMAAFTDSPAWQALTTHYAQIKDVHLRTLFAEDPGRAQRFSAEGAGLFLDYSKNRITDETLQLLLAVAKDRGVANRRDAMFAGDKINATERRAVLHVALRAGRGAAARSVATPASASATWSTLASAAPIWDRRWPISRCGTSATGR
jgi:hypothetical protein